MKEGRVDGSDESEDQSIDLNQVPVERKRKRPDDSQDVKLAVVSPEGTGRVLRSRTMALADGEKQVEVDMDACEVLVSSEKRRGRPKKVEGKCGVVIDGEQQQLSVSEGTFKMVDEGDSSEVSVPLKKEKRRGRPPKGEGKLEQQVSLVTIKTEEGGNSEMSVSLKIEKRRGRPPKGEGKREDVTDGEKHASVSDETVKMMGEDGSSQDACEVSATLKTEKRRGRPKKGEGKCGVGTGGEQLVSVSAGTIEKVDEDGTAEGAGEVYVLLKTGKRRGRPPKSDVEQLSSVSGETIKTVDEAPKEKRRGRPPKGGSKSGAVTDDKQSINRCLTNVVDRSENNEGPSVSLQREKVKRGPGRPPKSEVNRVMIDGGSREVADQNENEVPNISSQCTKMEGRRGRPPKVESKDGDESEVLHISVRDKMKKDRRGRPPKAKGEGGVSYLAKAPVLMKKKKMKGRPPMVKGKSGASLLHSVKEEGKVIREKKVGNGIKRGPGRPPKEEDGSSSVVAKNKRVKIDTDDEKAENLGARKRLEIIGSSRNSITLQKKTEECAEGKDLGLREQKQLLRDQIVAMLFKAGWKIEYRKRLTKEYQDAIYVDREGRGFWSVTLAYKKLKERIDNGKATEVDIEAFSPIPDEKFSMLFRMTTKGKKVCKKKDNGGVTIKKASKVKAGGNKLKSKKGKGTLRSRVPGDGSDKGGYQLYEGKLSLLSWMIDLGTVSLGGKVKYKRGRTKKMVLNGKITKDGICCECCNTIHTIHDFETHAQSDLGEPYRNLYLESGSTLFESLVDSWKKYVENAGIRFVHVDVDGDDPNDDTCNICGDGGNLICCDSCPSTFHNGCLNIKIPSGDWHCIYCSCKFCGMAGECTSMTDVGHDLVSDLSMCRMCEEKFHANCKDAEDFDQEDPSFCGNKCQKIFEQLHDLLGVKHELEEGFFYTVLHHQEVGSETSLDGYSSIVERNSKLAVAFKVMDECFQPITDERSGTNMIQNVVYNCGSNIRRLNYHGFYTVILEKGDELVAAASIRIHGTPLAEMPFIGTRYKSRRQGMCSRLLTAIEKVLSSLGVEKLIIPAIDELSETWTKVFGFSLLEESERQQMKYMSLIVFPKTNMLQKPVGVHTSTKQPTDCTAMECTEVGEEHHSMKENTESNSVPPDVEKQSHNKAAVVESNADLPDAPAVKSNETEHSQITQEQNEDKCLDSLSLYDVTSEVELDNKGKVDEVNSGDKESDSKTNYAAEKESDTKTSNANNHRESAANGSFVKKSNDNDAKIEVNTGIDCNAEPPEECEEEPKSCINGLLSVVTNGNCNNEQDISGGSGEEEVKVERQEVVC